MERDAYRRFSEDLLRAATADPEVLGLVALGSMADRGVAPDAWSDHDLFLITRDGRQQRYRDALDWLPDPDAIVWSYQETAHGLKVVYRSGHLVELAVFSLAEIDLARVNRYRVLLDRADVGARMAAVAERTREETTEHAPSLDWVINQLLGEILVASLRGGRGEELSARARLLAAVRWFCIAWARALDPAERQRLDDLDPFRRVEQVAPELGGRLHRACTAPVAESVRELLATAERELPLDDAQRRAVVAIGKRFPG